MTNQDLVKATELSKSIDELEKFVNDLEQTHIWEANKWRVVDKLPQSFLSLKILDNKRDIRRTFDQQAIISKLSLREGSDAKTQVLALAKQYHTLITAMANEELKILKKEFQEFTGSAE